MTETIGGDVYLTAIEAMERLQVSRPTFDALVRDKTLKRYRQSFRRRVNLYKESEVVALLEIREATEEDEEEKE